MSATTDVDYKSPATASGASRSRGGKALLVGIVIAGLILSAVVRDLAIDCRRSGTANAGAPGGRTSLSSMNSYALALLLGGLRGPLVMFLWPSAESQKTERNLEDFDTKIEWIRLLQAEFDTVHIFQIWNKAYNISVQMANVANKYTTILDALDYAQKVDAERPNNVNIIAAVGQIYFDKLGTSQEKPYYSRRIRAESLPHETRQKLRQDEQGWRRLELDPVLDEKGNVLPEYLRPGNLKLTDPKTGQTYDASQLQFVPRFGPYPYGLSPFGFAYNYYKRAQLLQEVGKQRHAQLSDLVVDSRPALSLKNWAEDEARHARRNEIAATDQPPPADDMMLDEPTQSLAPDASFPPDREKLARQAVFEYDLATRLVTGAHAEYERHTAGYPTNMGLYRGHRDGLTAMSHMAAGDRDYLAALLATDRGEKRRLQESAAASYRRAIDMYDVLVLRYATAEHIRSQLFPPGVNRENISEIDRNLRRAMVAQVLNAMQQGDNQEFADDAAEYFRAIIRAENRVQSLIKAGVTAAGAAPATAPATQAGS